MEKERFLPIGSVVLLKGGQKELMITSYCIFPNGETYENGEKQEAVEGKMFEYGACAYPEGIINPELIYGFNHDQIDKVCFVGYKTESSDQMSEVLNGSLEIYKKKQEEKAAGTEQENE